MYMCILLATMAIMYCEQYLWFCGYELLFWISYMYMYMLYNVFFTWFAYSVILKPSYGHSCIHCMFPVHLMWTGGIVYASSCILHVGYVRWFQMWEYWNCLKCNKQMRFIRYQTHKQQCMVCVVHITCMFIIMWYSSWMIYPLCPVQWTCWQKDCVTLPCSAG